MREADAVSECGKFRSADGRAAPTSSTRPSPRFAAAHADQDERDHQSLVDTVASGRLNAERDM